jgi:hypothetical protein
MRTALATLLALAALSAPALAAEAGDQPPRPRAAPRPKVVVEALPPPFAACPLDRSEALPFTAEAAARPLAAAALACGRGPVALSAAPVWAARTPGGMEVAFGAAREGCPTPALVVVEMPGEGRPSVAAYAPTEGD